MTDYITLDEASRIARMAPEVLARVAHKGLFDFREGTDGLEFERDSFEAWVDVEKEKDRKALEAGRILALILDEDDE